jgi:valacyclovir hydrolase
MPYADLSTGVRLYYTEAGQGEPLLLAHGLLGSAEVHFPRVIDWLRDRYRLIGPTLRGYGLSTPGPRSFPPDFYQRDAADLVALLDALGIDRAHLLGYSDGGEAALIAAGTHPGRFHSVAVIGAIGYFAPSLRPRIQSMFPANWITEKEKQRNGITNADAFILPWIQSMKRIIDQGGDVSLHLAPNITCPLLMMLGQTDTLNPADLGQQFIDRTNRGRLEVFDCGHAVHDEAWPRFQQVYGDFLQQASTPS